MAEKAADSRTKSAPPPGDDGTAASVAEKPTAETAGTSAADALQSGRPSTAAALDNLPSVFSDAVYACDRQYAIVLAQLMSNNEREKVYAWIERLDKMVDCDEMREERDKYLKFLTLSLSNRKLVPPFTKTPPPGLREVNAVVPKSVYNLIFDDKHVSGDCRPPKEVHEVRTFSQPDQVEPSMFFSRQPVPRNGGIVYAAAFSTRKP